MSYQNITAANYHEKKTHRPLVLTAVILAMFMAAIEGTIVATAMPGIVSDLGNFSLYSWVFSAYLLMQSVSILIYGKLSDLFGRKPIFVFGIIIFLIGSLLCGFATSMFALILFRFIQGLGAGAVQPIATTIVGDMYSIEERAKIQGYLSSVWGISAILGPLLGGLLVQYFHWAWIFWLNIPLGILAIIGVVRFLHESPERKKQQIDYTGSLLLLFSVSALMLVFIQGGIAWKWTSFPIICLIAVFFVCFILFIIQEKRCSEPVMPLKIWKHSLMAFANAATLTSGMIMMGVSTFLPTFVQGVMGKTPIIAGFTLTTMSIGWPIASTMAGRLIIKIGFRTTALIGGLSLVLGAIFFVLLTPSLGPVWAGTASFFVGVGMGLTSTTFIVAIQSSVDWNTRGIATANNMFMRILGSAIGAALLGGILNSQMKRYFLTNSDGIDASLTIDAADVLLNESQRNALSQEVLSILKDGLTYALHSVHLGIGFLAVLTLVFIFFLPKPNHSPQRNSQ